MVDGGAFGVPGLLSLPPSDNGILYRCDRASSARRSMELPVEALHEARRPYSSFSMPSAIFSTTCLL